MTTTNTTPASVGRERTCAQCGTVYRSPRASSRFCSEACRVKAHRQKDPRQGEVLRKRLEALGFLGPIGPWNSKNPRPTMYGLLVPIKHALAEINDRYNRPSVINSNQPSHSLRDALRGEPTKLQPDMTEQEFKTLLRKHGIHLPKDST